MNQCKDCGNKFSRLDNLKRHQITCKVQNKPETVLESDVKLTNNTKQQSDATSHIDDRLETNTKENLMLKSKNPKLTASVVNKIINTTPNGHNDSMIQPSVGNGKDNSIGNPDKIPTIHEAAKQLKIIPESDDESEGSIV